MEWKREDICGFIFFPVNVVDVLNPAVVHTNDAQVELLDTQDVPERVHVLTEPGAAKRHNLLKIPYYYTHF